MPSLYGFEGIFSAMLQISRLVVCHELDDARPEPGRGIQVGRAVTSELVPPFLPA